MNRYIYPFTLCLLLLSGTAFAEDESEPKPTNKLVLAGSILTGIGLLGLAAKDSGGSSSSGFFEAQKASGLVVLAGISLIVIGNKKETSLGVSFNESQPVLSFVHRF